MYSSKWQALPLVGDGGSVVNRRRRSFAGDDVGFLGDGGFA